jgi:ABC-type transport system involved in multi-copper enzyme maturation permease subunit
MNPPPAVPDLPPMSRHRRFAFYRVWAIAGGTLTQLVRMKVFYFMAIFSVIFIGASFVFADFKTEQELRMLKDVALAAMSLFALLFAVAGTALLLPRDLEDRTLYTILCKPVSRLEYLLGKFAGVAALIALSLACMNVLTCGVLYLKEHRVIANNTQLLKEKQGKRSDEMLVAAIANEIKITSAQGVTWNLQKAVVAIFLKAVVVTAVTLLLSTVASSTIFTIMAALALMVIGHGQAMARDYLLEEHSAGPVARLLAGAVALFFPDFRSYDIVDAVVLGTPVPGIAMVTMGGLTIVYCVIYLMAAWFVFADKEI